MIIRKERNILMAYEDDKVLGGFNITSGSWIGKSGNPIKSKPACFTFEKLSNVEDDANSYGKNIEFFLEYFSGTYAPDYTEKIAQNFEALISVGLYPDDPISLNNVIRLTKDVVEYFKYSKACKYDKWTAEKYLNCHHYRSVLNDPEIPWARNFLMAFNNSDITLPEEYLRTALRRCAREKVREFFESISVGSVYLRMKNVIENYYNIAMELFGSVKVEKNFLTHYSELVALKKQYDEEHYEELLQKHNDLPALYFEDKDFIIRPLITREMFHDEAEQQHNCVERLYMEKVKNGETHIVSVRRKACPNEALITCEVDNKGRIQQFLAFANNRPDVMFQDIKHKYNIHLAMSMR